MRLPAFLMLAASIAATAPVQAQPGARDRFMSRCQQERAAADPAGAEALCAEIWPTVTASNRLVDALFALASAGPLSTPDQVRRALPMVTWRPGPMERGTAAAGALGDLTVAVSDATPPETSFSWSEVGTPIPYNPAEALRVRGATLVEIGCYDFGYSESTTVYRVEAPGQPPFALTVYRREAPTANAWSTLSASVRTDGRTPSLADLRAREPDSEWKVGCLS